MALQETAARRFCDCQPVRSSPRLAVMLGLRHGGRDLLRILQGRSRVGQCGQLHRHGEGVTSKKTPGLRSSHAAGLVTAVAHPQTLRLTFCACPMPLR